MTISDSDTEELPEEGGWDLEDEEEGTDEEGADEASDDEQGSDATASDSDEARPRRARRDDGPAFEPDERARKALGFVADVVQKMGMDCRVRLRRPSEGNAPDEINLEISGRDSGRIIGKKGQ